MPQNSTPKKVGFFSVYGECLLPLGSLLPFMSQSLEPPNTSLCPIIHSLWFTHSPVGKWGTQYSQGACPSHVLGPFSFARQVVGEDAKVWCYLFSMIVNTLFCLVLFEDFVDGCGIESKGMDRELVRGGGCSKWSCRRANGGKWELVHPYP